MALMWIPSHGLGLHGGVVGGALLGVLLCCVLLLLLRYVLQLLLLRHGVMLLLLHRLRQCVLLSNILLRCILLPLLLLQCIRLLLGDVQWLLTRGQHVASRKQLACCHRIASRRLCGHRRRRLCGPPCTMPGVLHGKLQCRC